MGAFEQIKDQVTTENSQREVNQSLFWLIKTLVLSPEAAAPLLQRLSGRPQAGVSPSASTQPIIQIHSCVQIIVYF